MFGLFCKIRNNLLFIVSRHVSQCSHTDMKIEAMLPILSSGNILRYLERIRDL